MGSAFLFIVTWTGHAIALDRQIARALSHRRD
jgi:hypothetical protein